MSNSQAVVTNNHHIASGLDVGIDHTLLDPECVNFFGNTFHKQDFEILRHLLEYFNGLPEEHPIKHEVHTKMALEKLAE